MLTRRSDTSKNPKLNLEMTEHRPHSTSAPCFGHYRRARQNYICTTTSRVCSLSHDATAIIKMLLYSVISLEYIIYISVCARSSIRRLNCFRSHQKIELIRLIYSPHGRHYCFFHNDISLHPQVARSSARALLCLPACLPVIRRIKHWETHLHKSSIPGPVERLSLKLIQH